jgi:hypothetical protein
MHSKWSTLADLLEHFILKFCGRVFLGKIKEIPSLSNNPKIQYHAHKMPATLPCPQPD